MATRYYIEVKQDGFAPVEREASREEFIRAERAAGFSSKVEGELATDGFMTKNFSGRIEHSNKPQFDGGETPAPKELPHLLYIVTGVSHAYRVKPSHSVGLCQFMTEWTKQWTTPNNTRMVVGLTKEAALTAFANQDFMVPYQLHEKKTILASLEFTVLITTIAGGLEIRSEQQQVFLNPEE